MSFIDDIDLFLEKTSDLHGRSGQFVSQDDVERGSSSEDGRKKKTRKQSGGKPRSEPVMGACGREARKAGGDVRCWDGKIKDPLGKSPA